MRLHYTVANRIRLLFRRGKAGVQLDDELRFHLDRQIAENISAGMTPDEARCAALRSLGNPALLREQVHDTWSWNWLESFLRDLGYSLRTLRRTPGFALMAVLVIGFGIAANVALFTVVRSVLLKPLPFQDPSRLVRVYESDAGGRFPHNSSAGGVYAEWKKQSHSFTGLALCGYAGYNLSSAGDQLPEVVRAATFSWDLLPTLGVTPALGRNFTAADDQPSANGTVLLSWGLWKRRFGGDPAIINRTVYLNARPYTVIGVMPEWFAFPEAAIQLWTPTYYKEPPSEMNAIDDHEFRVIGRLKPGVTPAQANNELSMITRRIHNQHLDKPFVSIGANIAPLLDALVGRVKTPLYVLLGATGCLLLIACLNVANLLVARAAARRKELAVRTALGGSRLRLLCQHLMESLLLSVAGGFLGFLLAIGALQWFIRTRHDMARAESIGVDWVVVAFAAGLVILCALFAGMVSAVSVRGNQSLASLQESSRRQTAGSSRVRLRAVLLSIEVSLTVVLLIGAGLLMRSYARLRSTDLGCLTENVLKMDIDLPQARYKQPAEVVGFLQTLLDRVRNLPGAQAAGYIFPVVPGDGYGGDNGFAILEHPPLPPGQTPLANHRWTDPGYFAAIGIPILRGRTFDDNQHPGHGTEVIISDEFAREFLPGEDPIGKHLKAMAKTFEIVGVVGDTRTAVGVPISPMMYVPLYAADDINGASLVVRSGNDVTQLSMPIQRLVAQMDRDLPVSDVLTMDQVVGRNTLDASFNATLLVAFAVISLLLAAVGLFGVLSYIVAQRTSEIGIRIALGAQRENVLRLMLTDGLRPALIGLVAGLIASVAMTRLIESMLYETKPLDAGVFVSVTAVLLAVAAVACMVPAWRASRLDPMQALRTE